MNVTQVSLDALLLKATHESLPCPDALALEAFCSVMRNCAEGPQLAAQALSARIHSQNAREALLALATVDRCMRKCGSNFHAEIGKFRFLNEMIKLVSPKYFANRTAPEVQTKVLQLLHAWSIEYPKETKFKVAFDMLKNQGVVKETPPPLPPEDVVVSPRNKNAIFEDEEKSSLLQKLLQSKKPEDLQHANRLIKSMVREEERRSEANFRRTHEVASALDSAGLLQDMLLHAFDATADEEQLIDELFARCGRLRPVLRSLASAETNQENLEDIINSIDILDGVGEAYKKCMAEKKAKKQTQSKSTNSNSLLDFAGGTPPIGDGDKVNVVKSQVIDDLGDIFSAKDGPSNIAEPLKPVNLMPDAKQNDDVDLLSEKASKAEGWNELDSLGAQLLKQALPDNAKRLDNFNSKHVKKMTMRELEKSSPKHSEPKNGGELDLDFFAKKQEEKPEAVPVSPNDDDLVDISETVNATADRLRDSLVPIQPKEHQTQTQPTDRNIVEPITDITVNIASLTPSELPPMEVLKEEEGVTVVLEFYKDKPRHDVNVIVVVTTNNSPYNIVDYRFQPVVPKGCKVRLLPATGSALPAAGALRLEQAMLPAAGARRLEQAMLPAAGARRLEQAMLLAAPAAARPDLRFVVTYVADEPRSEMGHVPRLPTHLL